MSTKKQIQAGRLISSDWLGTKLKSTSSGIAQRRGNTRVHSGEWAESLVCAQAAQPFLSVASWFLHNITPPTDSAQRPLIGPVILPSTDEDLF